VRFLGIILLLKAASSCNFQAQSVASLHGYTMHSIKRKLTPVVLRIVCQYIILKTPPTGRNMLVTYSVFSWWPLILFFFLRELLKPFKHCLAS